MLISILFSNPILYLMVCTAILFGFSIHEYSHGLAAYLLGDDTAKLAGRLSINPLVHFDPIGTTMIFIFGFGWGKPVPFNPFNLRDQRWGPAIVGLSGPLSNFLMAGFAGLLLRFLPLQNLGVVVFLQIFTWLNLILGVFNLIPVPPLDGYHILFALLPPSLEGIKRSILAQGPLFLLFAFFFMVYFGYSFIVPFLFRVLTGMPLLF